MRFLTKIWFNQLYYFWPLGVLQWKGLNIIYLWCKTLGRPLADLVNCCFSCQNLVYLDTFFVPSTFCLEFIIDTFYLTFPCLIILTSTKQVLFYFVLFPQLCPLKLACLISFQNISFRHFINPSWLILFTHLKEKFKSYFTTAHSSFFSLFCLLPV